MKKLLITSGCSFSEPGPSPVNGSNWTTYLEGKLKLKGIHSGMGCQGNGLIYRRTLYSIYKALQEYKPEEILVGIMWSGPGRMDWYTSDATELPDIDNWDSARGQKNPVTFIPGATGGWVYVNSHWSTDWAENFYTSRYADVTALQIRTYELILNTQSFLKNLGIDYFMTTYTSSVFHSDDDDDKNINWMKDLIDFTSWLPVDGCLNWCYNHTNLPFMGQTTREDLGDEFGKFSSQDIERYGGEHPSSLQHKLFTEEVILPFLKQKNFI